MNPLTLVKRIQNINSKEASLGISEGASWHAKYKESAYVFVGGIPFDLTEGDLLAVFAQYGEIVDVNLVRDKGTGKSKGFAFVAYEDQRSTNLAVDNLNGASVLGRIIRVDHVTKYKKKEEEDEEEEQRKREERGVCHAFQRGQCNRGAACKFSHNEQRCADTGWGAKDKDSKWGHDKYGGPSKSHRSSGSISNHIPEPQNKERDSAFKSDDKGKRMSREEDGGRSKSYMKRSEVNAREQEKVNAREQEKEGMRRHPERSEKEHNHKDSDRRGTEKRSRQDNTKPFPKEDRDWRRDERKLRKDSEQNLKEDRDRREERSERRDLEMETKTSKDHDRRGREERSERHNLDQDPVDYRDRRGGEKRSRYDRDSSSHRNQEEDEVHDRRSRK